MELRRICKYKYAGNVRAVDPYRTKIHINRLYFLSKHQILIDAFLICGIILFTTTADLKEDCMDKKKPADPKKEALREYGALNTHPVTDALFKDNDFFDSRDLVQVKYEMLRKVQKESEPISHAAASFGFSRPSFYKSSSGGSRSG